jgi:hypothetical protein
MGEEVEFIPIELPLTRYETHMNQLIAALLLIDEKMFPAESESAGPQEVA